MGFFCFIFQFSRTEILLHVLFLYSASGNMRQEYMLNDFLLTPKSTGSNVLLGESKAFLWQ